MTDSTARTRADAVITVHAYEPAIYDQPDAGQVLTRIHVEESFSGDIVGAGFVVPDPGRFEALPLCPEPQTYYDGGLVYDRRNRVFVLFGCMGRSDRTETPKTWTFDPATRKWTRMRPATSPPERTFHKLVWHDKLGAAVMFGQMQGNERHLEDLWVYETAADRWTEVKTAAAPSIGGATVYDASQNAVVLYNKPGQTWVLRIEPGSPAVQP
jgi:hypothetical protein